VVVRDRGGWRSARRRVAHSAAAVVRLRPPPGDSGGRRRVSTGRPAWRRRRRRRAGPIQPSRPPRQRRPTRRCSRGRNHRPVRRSRLSSPPGRSEASCQPPIWRRQRRRYPARVARRHDKDVCRAAATTAGGAPTRKPRRHAVPSRLSCKTPMRWGRRVVCPPQRREGGISLIHEEATGAGGAWGEMARDAAPQATDAILDVAARSGGHRRQHLFSMSGTGNFTRRRALRWTEAPRPPCVSDTAGCDA